MGELIQIDGSDHRWFEDRAPACTLLVFIDDATSRLMTLHFTATESTFSYFEATRHIPRAHGKPVALYSDKASVFHCNNQSSTPDKGVTQYGRALYELNVDTLCANSSQAKGRVERANLTLQDRLVKELRLRGSIRRRPPTLMRPTSSPTSTAVSRRPRRAHSTRIGRCASDEDLDLILTHRVLRCVSNSLTLQYDRVIYMLDDSPANRALIHHYLDVYRVPGWAHRNPG